MSNEYGNEDRKKQINKPARRNFIKKVGIGIVSTAAYTLVSLSNFGCDKYGTAWDKRGYY